MADREPQSTFHVLYLEDSDADRQLAAELLREDGLDARFTFAETRAEFEGALAAGGVDLILSDYSLPAFDGLTALRFAHQNHPEIPFILLSGVMGEERAVESLKGGATDYVLKQRIERLAPSIRRAVREAAERRKLRAAEQQLRESEQRLRQITDNVSDLIFQIDAGGAVQYSSPSCRRLLDVPALPPGADFFELVAEADRERVRDLFREVVRTGVGCRVEWSLRRSDGTRHPLESQINLMGTAAGGVGSLIVLARDVAGRDQAGGAGGRNTELVEFAEVPMIACDNNGVIFYRNAAFGSRPAGRAADTARGNLRELLEAGPDGDLETAMRITAAKGRWQGHLRKRNADGQTVAVWCHWTRLRNPQGGTGGFLLTLDEDAPAGQNERKFLRDQRFATLNALAGALARELDGVLTPIALAGQLLRRCEFDGAGRNWREGSSSRAGLGDGLVRQLLTHARTGAATRAAVSPGIIVRQVEQTLNQSLDPAVAVEVAIGEDLWTVSGNAEQLRQLLLILAVNGREAIEGTGRLALSAANIVIAERDSAARRGVRPGMHVLVTVEDSGTGIPAHLFDTVFDPFYTGKTDGSGAGLGLTTARLIVNQHAGSITVDSKVGEGTRVAVYLPAVVSRGADEPAISGPVPHLIQGHGECILLVDDEAPFREITLATLEKHGYRVLTAADGSDALALFMRHRREIRLVLTDIVMPVMDGAALIKSLQKMDAKVAYIAVSGLMEIDRRAVRDAAPDAVVEFLAKPFSTARLLSIVHEVLHPRVPTDPGPSAQQA